MCKSCVHETVCRYKTEFENLKNEIAKVTPVWAPHRYTISIECRNYRRDAASVLSAALKAKEETQ